MPTYTVSPIPGSTRWAVLSNGRRVSRHNTKTNAVSEARRLRNNNGGTVTIKGSDGQFERRINPR